VTPGAEGAPEATTAALSAAAATTGRSVLGGSAWSATGKLLPQLYTLAVSIAAARFLTSGEFGRQSFIAFVELSLVMLLTAGLPIGLMRYIGETLGRDQPAIVRGLVRWAWGVELVAAAAGAGVLVLLALLGAEPTGAWALAGVACALGILHTVPSALLIGAQLWRSATIAGLLSGSVGTVATVAVLWAGGGITGMFAVEAGTSALILAWTSVLARRAVTRLSPTVASPGPLRRAVTRWTLVASVGVLLNFVVWRRSELFFLDAFSSNDEIAQYSIAFSLVVAIVRLPEALAEVSSPAIATLFGAGEHARIRSGYGRAARLVLIMALPLTVAGFALGPSAIRTIWGSNYSDAGTLLLIMLSTFPMLPLFYIARGALVGIGRQKVLIAASALAAVVDVGLAAALVPPFDAVGAALANAGAQLAAGIPIIVAARRTFGEIDWAPGALLRTAVASAAAGLAALGVVLALGGVAGLLLGLFTGVAVFALAAATVKILPADDARWLAGALGRIGGGRLGRLALLCARRP
jgi:O-antigen/teichoic acid export membrane protein